MASNQPDRSNNSGPSASAGQENTDRTNGDSCQVRSSSPNEGESAFQASVAVPVSSLRVRNGSTTGDEYQQYYNYGQSDEKPNGAH
jgi:hypothetical protein